MRAVAFGPSGGVEVVDVPVPSCGPDQVVLRVVRAGICGSDLSFYRGDRAAPGNIAGHELAGVVEEVGPLVDHVAVGDLVTAESVTGCGGPACTACASGAGNRCPERRFMPNLGPGAFAELAVVAGRSTRRVHGLDPAVAALAEPTSVALHVADRANSSRVAVLGCGPIGLLTSLCLASRGTEVTAVYRWDHQAYFLRRCAPSVACHHGTVPGGAPRFGAAVVAAGDPAALDHAIELVDTGGTIVLAGGYSAPVGVRLRAVVSKELTLVGTICARTYSRPDRESDIDAALRFLRSCSSISSLVSHTLALEDAPAAFAAAHDKRSGALRVQLAP